MATEEGCVDLIRTVKHGIMDERATAAVPRPIRVPGALGEMMREEKEEEDGFTSASADPNGWLHSPRDLLKEESEDEYEELQVAYVLSSPSGYSSPTLPSSSPPRKPYGIYLFLNHGVSFSWTSLRVLCYICDVGCWFPVLLERKARTRDRNVLPMGLLYTLFGQTAGTSSGQLAGYHRFLGQDLWTQSRTDPRAWACKLSRFLERGHPAARYRAGNLNARSHGAAPLMPLVHPSQTTRLDKRTYVTESTFYPLG